MKYFKALFLLLIFSNCQAQEIESLLKKKQITDWSSYPIYGQLVNSTDTPNDWKEEYAYLDDIEVYAINYLSDGLNVRGLMVRPKKKGKYPCVIYNRGGNRGVGRLVAAHGALRLGQLAKEGYVVIASQYRGNAGGEGQEEFGGKDVNDVLSLIDVLEEVESADTERIGMYGWSRGGMMTYLALCKTDKIKAAITGGALADMTEIDRPEMETNVYAELIPDYWNNKAAELKKRSAIHWVDQFPKNVPILLLHGNADWRVKSTQSLRLALEFEKHRIPYRLKIFEGGDHGISEHRAEVDEEVLNWLNKYLKEEAPLPIMEFHGR